MLFLTFTGIFSNQAIPIAIPGISRALAVFDVRIGLVMTAFFVPSTLMMVAVGILADIYGRRTVVPPVLLFGISGTLVIFVSSFKALLALRII